MTYFFYRLAGWALLFAIALHYFRIKTAKSKQKDLGKMIRHLTGRNPASRTFFHTRQSEQYFQLVKLNMIELAMSTL